MERFDAGVVGLGAMGSAACAHLAMRGMRTIGFERFDFAHANGSSGGHSRIIRKAYFEDVAYVPLLQRAYELWHDLERRTSMRLLELCGVLVVDDANGATAAGVTKSARAHGVGITAFDAAELRERYPGLRILEGEIGILEPDAGVVFPEAGIRAHLELARAIGAVVREHAPVAEWRQKDGAIHVRFGDGETVAVSRLIVTAGSWTCGLLPELALPLQVQRNVQYWFQPAGGDYSASAFPAFFLERAGLPAPLYGVPDMGDGVKLALHGYGELTDPDELDRSVGDDEIRRMREIAGGFMPEAATAVLRSTKVCMYTNTPDRHFAIGPHPQAPHVIVAAGFSGHGYKFAPAIGEVLASLAVGDASRRDVEFLHLARLIKN